MFQSDTYNDLKDLRNGQRKRFVTRLAVDDRKAINSAETLRDRAKILKESVSRGSYDDVELNELIHLVHEARRVLHVTSAELSERSSLGPNFFTSLVRDQPRPRLVNFLRALNGIVETANDRLIDFDREVKAEVAAWIPNNTLRDRSRAQQLEHDLREFIDFLSTSNYLAEMDVTDRYWIHKLRETLVTVLAIIDAPLVETSILHAADRQLRRIGSR